MSGIIAGVSDDLRPAVAFGPDQPQRFLTEWLGLPSRDMPVSAASNLPGALAWWHRQAGRWDPQVMRQNHVPASRRMDGDMLLVGIETNRYGCGAYRTPATTRQFLSVRTYREQAGPRRENAWMSSSGISHWSRPSSVGASGSGPLT